MYTAQYSMNYNLIIFIIAVVFIYIAVILWFSPESHELFGTAEDTVLDIYARVLRRQPNPDELVAGAKAVNTGVDLEMKLKNTEEYARMIKLQSNELTPELDKMLSDQAILQKIMKNYRLERGGKPVPPHLVLAYKDLYVYMDYNDYTFRAFLRHRKYPDFEDLLLRTNPLNHDITLKLFKEWFNLEELQKEGQAILAREGLPSAAGKGAVARTLDDKDSDLSKLLEGIQKRADDIFNKHEAAIAGLALDAGTLRVHDDPNDLVLRPDMAWSVPQPRTPVCTTLGQPALPAPVQLPSKEAMWGTPLPQAADTGVGTIMPRFKMTEFIDTKKNALIGSGKVEPTPAPKPVSPAAKDAEAPALQPAAPAAAPAATQKN